MDKQLYRKCAELLDNDEWHEKTVSMAIGFIAANRGVSSKSIAVLFANEDEKIQSMVAVMVAMAAKVFVETDIDKVLH